MFHTKVVSRFSILFVCAIFLCPFGFWPSETFAETTGDFRFVFLGDRTGEAQPGVFETVWREIAADRPKFVVSVGDMIQGGNDATLDVEWKSVMQLMAPYRKIPLYLAPGNHDVWSPASAKAYVANAHHPLHYSFDFEQAHFTILDNSRTEAFSAEEMTFLEKDLAAHNQQRVKFIVSHRPSWIFQAVLSNPNFPLHRLAKKYGVQYVIAGHIHQMLRFELDGITYLSLASSGGHLRDTKAYERGWFFQHTVVDVHGGAAKFTIKEAAPPIGKGRISRLADWGVDGLAKR